MAATSSTATPDSGPLAPPQAAAVVRAFITTPPGGYWHPVPVMATAVAAEHRMRAQVHQAVGTPGADKHAVAAVIRTEHQHDANRAVLIDGIDRWAAAAQPEERTRVLHTESLHQLIDRPVIVWIRGQLLVDSGHATADPQLRVASAQLGEPARAYDGLITDLLLGRRQLPVLQTPPLVQQGTA